MIIVRYLGPNDMISIMSSPPSFSHDDEEPLEESTSSAVTPLLSQTPRGGQTKPIVDDVFLQFYDPSAMLTLSRDVAFGYLILLTGGNLDLAEESLKAERDCHRNSHIDIGYVAPSIRRNGQSAQPPENDAQREIPESSPTKSAMDESTASLAYAAIVDGNVLPACFGLKTLGNGRVLPAGHPPLSSGKRGNASSASLWDKLCCLPKLPTTSRHIMTNLPLPLSPRGQSKNSTEMQRTVECLRDIRDRHCQSLSRSHSPANSSFSATEDATTSLYMQVVYAYIHSFAAIVQYHDQLHQQHQNQLKQPHRMIIPSSKSKRNVFEILWCCLPFQRRAAKKASDNDDDEIEQVPSTSLEQTTLQQIQKGFHGLGSSIVRALDAVEGATDLASGVSV